MFRRALNISFKNNKAMSMVELMIAVGLVAVGAIFVMSLMTTMQKSQNDMQLVATLISKSLEIRNTLSSSQTVVNTISAAANQNMACLNSNDRTIPCNASFIASAFSISHDRIAIYDSATNPAGGNLYLDGRISNTTGFTEKGKVCTGFSYDGTGNDSCPLGYVVNWRISQAGTFQGVKLTITAKAIFNPSDSHPKKRLLNLTLKSALGKYDVVYERNLESLVDVNTLNCAQAGVVVPIHSARIFYTTESVPLGSTCISETRSCTELNGAPSLSGSAQYSTCKQNCLGSWTACSVPCGGGLQSYTTKVPNNDWGSACPYSYGTTVACNLGACGVGPQVDCVGAWSACANGFQTYNVTTWQSVGGVTCPTPDKTIKACGVDCVGTWSACVGGTQTYSITAAATGGGASCPYAAAQTRSCGVSCVGSWSDCIYHTQNFSVSIPAVGGGAACPAADGATRACSSCTWAENNSNHYQNYVQNLIQKIFIHQAKACVTPCSGVAGCDASVCCPAASTPCSTGGATTTCNQLDACTDSCSGAVRTLTCSCF